MFYNPITVFDSCSNFRCRFDNYNQNSIKAFFALSPLYYYTYDTNLEDYVNADNTEHLLARSII